MSDIKHDIQLLTFGGFYESIHSDTMDSELEMLSEEDDNLNLEYFRYTEELLTDYSKSYVEWYKLWLESEHDLTLESMDFKKLYSPQFYNFSTDTITVTISDADLVKLVNAVSLAKLQEVITEYFTDRSGFISFYSNDLNEWLEKPYQEWDAVEKGVLLACLIESDEWDMIDREEVCDLVCGHGSKQGIL